MSGQFFVAKEGMVNDCANEVPGLVTFYAGCGCGGGVELVTCIGS